MKKETYASVMDWYKAHRRTALLIIWGNRLITGLIYCLYPLLLVWLFLYRQQYLAKAVLVPGISFVLLSLFGAAIALKRGAHLGFTLLADHVPPVIARIFEVISALSGIIFSGVIFYYGIRMTMTQFQRGQLSLGVQIPEWIYGSFVPLGSFFLLIRFIEMLVNSLRGKAAAREDVLADALSEVSEEERAQFEHDKKNKKEG